MAKKPVKKPEATLKVEEDLLALCQEVIGHKFSRLELLRSALTHASSATNRLASFERLEFLGDSILGMLACEALFHRFPDHQEGDLTRVKSSVVSRRTCAVLAEQLDLMRFTILGKGFNAAQSHGSPNLLANVFESLIGAIYLDGGIDAARNFVMRLLGPEIERVAADTARAHHATAAGGTDASGTSGCCSRSVPLRRRGSTSSVQTAPATVVRLARRVDG
jgi:ribonuclease-3